MTATTLRREILGGAAVNMAAEVVVQLNWVRVYCQYNQTSTEPHKPPTTTRIQLTMHNPNAGVVDGPLVDGTTTVEPWVFLELIGGSGRTAGRYASAARALISPTAFEQARGGALGAGGGKVGFAGGGLFNLASCSLALLHRRAGLTA